MQCPSCGTRNNYYHHYCYFCGNALPTRQKDDLTDEHTNKFPYPYDYTDENDEIPLKRYKKTQTPRFSLNYLKFLTFLFVFSLLMFGVYRLFLFLSEMLITGQETAERVTATAIVESTIFEGSPSQRIIVHTNTGEAVEALGRRFPVRDGKAEMVFDNAYLHSRFPSAETQKGIEISFDIIVYKDGTAAYKETLNFTMEMPQAPLTLIQPEQGQAIVDGETYRLVFTVSEGSTVFINGDDFTDLLDDSGRFQKDLTVSDVPESTYEIRVIKRGFKDTTVNIVLKREEQIVPLTLDMELPIKAEGDSVIIRGRTHPKAQITTDLELIGVPTINPETGAFSIEVKSGRPGLSAGVLTSTSNDGKISQVDIVIFRTMTEAEYTRRAWKPDFPELFAHPNLHNGQIFLFTGTISKVILYGDKNVFTVNVSDGPANPQHILVEFWGDFKFEPGDKIRVFGNRWGNHEEMVRVLAPFIYP
jgi:hypothetical protein